MDLRTAEAHSDAIGIGRHRELAVEKGRDLALGKEVLLWPDHGPEPRRPAQIEPVEPAVLAVAWLARAKRQPVACSQRAAVPASESAANIGRDAAEHGRDVEATLDGNVQHGPVGQRSDPDHLAPPQPDAPHGLDPLTIGRARIRQDVDLGMGADERKPNLLGIELSLSLGDEIQLDGLLTLWVETGYSDVALVDEGDMATV